MRGGIPSTLQPVAGALAPLLLVACASAPTLAQGILQGLRDEVRGSSSDSSSSSPSSSKGRDDDDDDDEDSPFHCGGGGRHHDHDDDCGFSAFVGEIMLYGVTSPWWGPHVAVGDNLSEWDSLCFPRFPYDHVPGYMMCDACETWEEDPACAADPLRAGAWPTRPRTWAARLRMEYADEFNDVARVSGHLLLDTRSRFGLDTETSYLEETLPDGTQDELWLGDCNVVFRFAQSQYAEFRTGLGFNWLDDPVDTDFGFNFTYGADLFPRRPWVVSATIDWGTLGDAELFRFRTTGGVVVCGVEVYTGYEYLDIDSTQMNLIVGGVRIWF